MGSECVGVHMVLVFGERGSVAQDQSPCFMLSLRAAAVMYKMQI